MRLKSPQDPNRMISTECVRMHGFRKQYWISWKLYIFCLLTLDLDNFHFIQVDFVADGGFVIDITHWIS